MRFLQKVFLLITAIIWPSLIMAQGVTITGTITDTQSTPYANGSLTVSLVNTTGQVATFGGSPTFQKLYSATLSSTGAFSISLPANSTASPSILPIGTQWNFSYQSQGGYGAANVSVTIIGAADISATLSNQVRITWPYGNIPPHIQPDGIYSDASGEWCRTSGFDSYGCGADYRGPGSGPNWRHDQSSIVV